MWLLGPPQRGCRFLSSEQNQPPSHQCAGFLSLKEPDGLSLQVLSNPGDSLNSTSLDMSCQEPLNVSQSFRKPSDRSSIHPSIHQKSFPSWLGQEKAFPLQLSFLGSTLSFIFSKGIVHGSNPIHRELEKQRPSCGVERWPGPRMSWLSTMLII